MNTIDKWVKRPIIHPQPRMRLFCLPHAGGGTSTFYGWTDELPTGIEICLLQLPGRESRLLEEPIKCLSSLVTLLADVLNPLLDCPFALFGHSLGALVSFEFARELRRRGLNMPVHLFVAGCRAPQINFRHANLYQLSDGSFVEYLASQKMISKLVLQEPRLMAYLLPGLRADFALFETYCYVSENVLRCPITIYGGLADQTTSLAELQAWQVQTTKECNLYMMPGDHFFLQDARTRLIKSILTDLGLTVRAS